MKPRIAPSFHWLLATEARRCRRTHVSRSSSLSVGSLGSSEPRGSAFYGSLVAASDKCCSCELHAFAGLGALALPQQTVRLSRACARKSISGIIHSKGAMQDPRKRCRQSDSQSVPIGTGHSLLQGLACVATTLTEISLSSVLRYGRHLVRDTGVGADVAEPVTADHTQGYCTAHSSPTHSATVMAPVLARQFCKLQAPPFHTVPCMGIPPGLMARPIASPLKADAWGKALAGHPNTEWVAALLTGMRQGFRIGMQEAPACRASSHNTPSTQEHRVVADQYIRAQLEKGYMAGLFSHSECAQLITSSVAVVPKKTAGK